MKRTSLLCHLEGKISNPQITSSVNTCRDKALPIVYHFTDMTDAECKHADGLSVGWLVSASSFVSGIGVICMSITCLFRQGPPLYVFSVNGRVYGLLRSH